MVNLFQEKTCLPWLLPQIGKNKPVGMVVRQIACQNKLHDDQDNPERPILPNQVALSPAPCQQDSADHGRQVDNDIQEHQLVMDEDPIGKESAYDGGYHGQSGQDGCAKFLDIMTAEYQIQAEQQHRIEYHLHVRHYAFHHGKDVAQEMIEERYMVHEMHACTQDGKQNDGGYGFLPGHGGRKSQSIKLQSKHFTNATRLQIKPFASESPGIITLPSEYQLDTPF